MPIHNLVLEPNSLVVGNNQLLTQANAVWVGNNLIVNNTIRWPVPQNVVAPGSDISTSQGLRILLYPDQYGIGIETGTVWYASGGNHRWYSTGTALGTFSTGGLNITTGANAVNFSNTTSNWIGWNQSGVAAPAVSTRSAGTKLLLYPNISATAVDYAIGVESGSMWFSVDNLNTTGFKWYANTTVLFQANSTGITQPVGNLNIDGGTLYVDAGPNRVNIGSTANNESTFNVLNNNALGNIATASLVDPATDLITTGIHGWANGQPVFIRATTTIPAGTSVEYVYYLCVRSTTTFTLHTTVAGSLAGTSNVDITSAGSGTITVHPISPLLSLFNSSGNANYLKVLNYRNASGADWQTSSTRITNVIDITNQAHIEFNPPGFTYGLALGSTAGTGVTRNFLTMSNQGQILFSNTTANTAMIAANGNLSIGSTTTPQYKLDVDSGVATNNFSSSFGSTIGSGFWSGIHFGYKEAANQLYRKSALVFERQDSSARGKVHILNDGAADAGTADLGDSKVTIQFDGNVGIGNTAPINKLRVEGDASILTTLAAGNTTITGFANVSGNTYVGNSTVFWTSNSTAINVGTSSVNTTVIAAGANVLINTTALFVGNSTVNTVVNSSSISVISIIANAASGTADQLLYANSTGGVYWRTPATITNVEPTTVGSTSNGHVWYVYI